MPRERRCDPQALRQCSGRCVGLFSGAADGKPFIVAITNSDLDSYQCIRLFAMYHIRGLFLKEPSPRAVDTAAILSRSLFGWLVRPPRLIASGSVQSRSNRVLAPAASTRLSLTILRRYEPRP